MASQKSVEEGSGREEFFTEDEASPSRKGMREGEDAQIIESVDGSDAPRHKKNMSLEKIVEFATWREMLLDLVATNELDPWNIDIIEIASSFIERIKKLEMLDLRVPANLILAAAILIRFKSDALKFEEETQVMEEQTYVEEDSGSEVIPILELKTRIPPKRMVTLDELLVAMEKVFDEQKKREEKASRIEIPEVINIQLPEFNIEQKMEEVYGRVLSQKDVEGLATFSSLLHERNAEEMITTLLPLLHLVQDRRLSIFQEKFFGEIFIRVREASETAKEKKGKKEVEEKAAG